MCRERRVDAASCWGAVGVEGWSSGCVDIAVADARCACEYGGHAEPDAHATPYNLRSSDNELAVVPEKTKV